MKILSFDTSSRSIHTCVLENRDVVHESVLEPAGTERQEAAAMLLPEIELALRAASCSKKDIDLVVVGAGPGSFTGVRIAVVTARSLGQGLGLGVVPVCFLDVVSAAAGCDCAVSMPAGAGQYFGAAYRQQYFDEGAFSLPAPVVEPFCANLSALLERLSEQETFVTPTTMQQQLPEFANKYQWPDINNIATAGAFLAFDRLSLCGERPLDTREQLRSKYPWEQVVPLYLRSPSITLKQYGNSTKENEPI